MRRENKRENDGDIKWIYLVYLVGLVVGLFQTILVFFLVSHWLQWKISLDVSLYKAKIVVEMFS